MLAQQRRLHFAQIDLAVHAARRNQLRSASVKLASAALVIFDVRVFMTDDAVKGLAKLCQGERICGRSVEDKKNVAIDVEKLAHPIAEPPGPFIIAIGCRYTGISFDDGSGYLGTNARRVVTREFLTRWNHLRSRYPSFMLRAIA